MERGELATTLNFKCQRTKNHYEHKNSRSRIMTKVKSNASWNGLSPKQKRSLETWLFDEKLGYQKTLERARKELGFKGSVSSLRRFYSRTAQERLLAGFTEAEELAEAVDGAPVSTARLRSSGMKIVGQMF